MLRSCYTADFKFFRDDPSLITKVRWYFVDDDADDLPFSTVFGSQIYEREPGRPADIGEQDSPVPWRGGDIPPEAGLGDSCGTAEQWREGCLTTDPVPINHAGTLIPICCGKRDLVGNLTSKPYIDATGFDICNPLTRPASIHWTFNVTFGSCPDFDGFKVSLFPASFWCGDTGTTQVIFMSGEFKIGGVPLVAVWDCAPDGMFYVAYLVAPDCSKTYITWIWDLTLFDWSVPHVGLGLLFDWYSPGFNCAMLLTVDS